MKPKLVAEIEFAGWTGDGNVRQAAFKGLREDKPAAEITTEEPEPVEEVEEVRCGATSAGKSRKRCAKAACAGAGPPVVMGVTISNPDKPLWPDAGDGEPVTKLDLAHYYEKRRRVAAAAHQGPAVLHRARAGWHWRRRRFFQRHAMQGTSSLLSLVQGERRSQALSADRSRRRPDRRGADRRRSSCIRGIASRASPKCRVGWCSISIRRPMWTSRQVIEAALEMRERLEALGLVRALQDARVARACTS